MLMLVFAFIDSMVRLLLWLVILLQAAYLLLTGGINPNILEFGRGLSTYHYHILLFLTFCTEKLPFPFTEWSISSDPKLLNTDPRD